MYIYTYTYLVEKCVFPLKLSLLINSSTIEHSEVSANKFKQEKAIRDIKIAKDVKLFADDILIYLENCRELSVKLSQTKNLLR